MAYRTYDLYATTPTGTPGVYTLGVSPLPAHSNTTVLGSDTTKFVLGDTPGELFHVTFITGNFTYLGAINSAAPGVEGFAATSPQGKTVVFLVNGATPGNGASFTIAADSASTPSTWWDLQVAAVVCFLEGTRIATPEGEVAVQDLAVGDRVTTWSGETKRITWIGSGRTRGSSGPDDIEAPVVIRAGALADRVPARDLRVTPGHSLLVDGVLVNAQALLNGRSIVRDTSAAPAAIFHVEIEGHDVLVADGAPAESYRNDGNRESFLLGAATAEHVTEADSVPPCAPVVNDGPLAERAWRRLAERAGLPVAVTLAPDLHLMVDGARVDPRAGDGERFVFELAERPDNVRLCSTSAVPAYLGLARDQRRLGVAIRRVRFRHDGATVEVDWRATALTAGCHAPEEGFRWTNGDAPLPVAMLSPAPGPVTIELEIAMAMPVADVAADGVTPELRIAA